MPAWATNASCRGCMCAAIHGTSHSTKSTTSAWSYSPWFAMPRCNGWSYGRFMLTAGRSRRRRCLRFFDSSVQNADRGVVGAGCGRDDERELGGRPCAPRGPQPRLGRGRPGSGRAVGMEATGVSTIASLQAPPEATSNKRALWARSGQAPTPGRRPDRPGARFSTRSPTSRTRAACRPGPNISWAQWIIVSRDPVTPLSEKRGASRADQQRDIVASRVCYRADRIRRSLR